MDKNSKYKSVDYWNDRYKDEESFEWFCDYGKFKEILCNHIKPTDCIVNLGCGNSKMSELMYLDGFKNLINIDYSETLIELMRDRCKKYKEMSWLTMDINNLQFEANSIDIIIEKGTLDSLLVDESDPWNMTKENQVKINNILKNISKILKPNGLFISITFAQPHFRVPIYANHDYNWSIKEFTIGETFHYFVYVMKKGEKLDLLKNYQDLYNIKYKFNTLMSIESNENYLLSIDF